MRGGQAGRPPGPTVHRFGDIVGSEATGAVIDPARAVLLEHIDTVAMRPQSLTPLGVLEHPRSVALRLEGRINHTDERLDAVFMFAAADAAGLVGEVLNAVFRALGGDGLEQVLRTALPMATRQST